MRKKTFILLSGIMIGSTLFAVPKKRETNNEVEVLSMMCEWISARPTEGAEADYYDQMEERAFQCVDIKDRCCNIVAFEKSAVFPLETDVSEEFRSLLSRYLPDHCSGAKEWRETIVDCVSKFRLGEKDVATIEDDLWNLTADGMDGAVTFDGANSMWSWFIWSFTNSNV
jgi:hypothetical protein